MLQQAVKRWEKRPPSTPSPPPTPLFIWCKWFFLLSLHGDKADSLNHIWTLCTEWRNLNICLQKVIGKWRLIGQICSILGGTTEQEELSLFLYLFSSSSPSAWSQPSSFHLVPQLPNQQPLPLRSPHCSVRLSLAGIVEHLKQGLEQTVISVPVRLGAVEAVTVVTVDTVLGAPVLVDHVQSLVQLLRRESRSRGREALAQLLLLPPGLGNGLRLLQRWGLPVEGRLQETQQSKGGGEGWIWGFFDLLLWVIRRGLGILSLLRLGLCWLL